MSDNSIFEAPEAEVIDTASNQLVTTLERYKAVTSNEELEKSTEILAQAKKFKKDLNDQRMALIRPSLDRQKQINDEAKKITDKLDRVIAHFEKISKDFMMIEHRRLQAEERERQAAEQRRIEEERAANQPRIEELQATLRQEKAALGRIKGEDTDAMIAAADRIRDVVAQIRELGGTADSSVPAPVAAPQARARAVGSMGSKSTLVEHWKAELVDINLVPREYLVVDWTKVNQAVQRSGVREIAGFKIEDVGSLRSRAS